MYGIAGIPQPRAARAARARTVADSRTAVPERENVWLLFTVLFVLF